MRQQVWNERNVFILGEMGQTRVSVDIGSGTFASMVACLSHWIVGEIALMQVSLENSSRESDIFTKT